MQSSTSWAKTILQILFKDSELFILECEPVSCTLFSLCLDPASYITLYYSVATCEIKLFWNNFEIISVIYFTCNPSETISKSFQPLKLFRNYFSDDIEHVGKHSRIAISLCNNYFEMISGKIISYGRRTKAEIILKWSYFTCNRGITNRPRERRRTFRQPAGKQRSLPRWKSCVRCAIQLRTVAETSPETCR